ADVDRFLQSLTAITQPPPQRRSSFRPTVAVTRKGVLPVESLLVARYQMFSSVYWHRTARGATSVLQYLVWRYLVPRDKTFDMSEFEERRARLLEYFLENTDESSIRWLSDEVARLYSDYSEP